MSVGIGPSEPGGPKRPAARGAESRTGVSTGGLTIGGGGGGARAGSPADGAPSPEDPALEALRAVAANERVRAAEDAVREACSELRWNEALRRRWREARAEAAIRGAIASGGAGEPAHFPEAVAAGADAVLAASLFHFGPDDMLARVKDALRQAGHTVR